jgi:hypothetical protein
MRMAGDQFALLIAAAILFAVVILAWVVAVAFRHVLGIRRLERNIARRITRRQNGAVSTEILSLRNSGVMVLAISALLIFSLVAVLLAINAMRPAGGVDIGVVLNQLRLEAAEQQKRYDELIKEIASSKDTAADTALYKLLIDFERRHAELLTAIAARQDVIVPKTEVTEVGVSTGAIKTLLVSVCIFMAAYLFIVGYFWFLRRSELFSSSWVSQISNSKVAMRSLATATATTCVTFYLINVEKVGFFEKSNFTLFRIERLANVEQIKIEPPKIEPSKTEPLRIEISYHVYPRPQDPAQMTDLFCGSSKDGSGENNMRIAPFPDGWATVEDYPDRATADIQKAFKTLESQISTVLEFLKSQPKRVASLMVIGSADRRQLATAAVRKRYGSNSGLAQARANWVKDKLVSDPRRIETQAVVAFDAGPSIFKVVSAGSASTELALDRAVQVCALWERAN